MNTNKKVFVTNLTLLPTANQLKTKLYDFVSPIGKITKVVLFKYFGTEILQGNGLVEFERAEDALLAIKTLDGQVFINKKISLTFFSNSAHHKYYFQTKNKTAKASNDESVAAAASDPVIIDMTDSNQQASSAVKIDWTKTNKVIYATYPIEKLLKLCNNFEIEETIEMIDKKLAHTSITLDDIVELPNSCYKLSLVCPFTKTKMSVPARGANCSHIECFDLKTFLLLSQQSSKWRCPICKYSFLNDLPKVDLFVQSIINGSRNAVEVILDKSGKWNPVKLTEKKKKKKKSCLSDPIDNKLAMTLTDSNTESDEEFNQKHPDYEPVDNGAKKAKKIKPLEPKSITKNKKKVTSINNEKRDETLQLDCDENNKENVEPQFDKNQINQETFKYIYDQMKALLELNQFAFMNISNPLETIQQSQNSEKNLNKTNEKKVNSNQPPNQDEPSLNSNKPVSNADLVQCEHCLFWFKAKGIKSHITRSHRQK